MSKELNDKINYLYRLCCGLNAQALGIGKWHARQENIKHEEERVKNNEQRTEKA
jgi:hypothetical protein